MLKLYMESNGNYRCYWCIEMNGNYRPYLYIERDVNYGVIYT